MAVHTNSQRFQTLAQHPRIERTHRWTCSADKAIAGINECLLSGNHTAEHTALAVDPFSGTVNDNIGTKFRRALQIGRCKTIVHHIDDVISFTYVPNKLEIDEI